MGDIIGCDTGALAKYMVENPNYHSACVAFLNGIRDLDKENSGLEDAVKKIEEAHKIATESEYFVFAHSWSWPRRTDQGNSEGYSVFQKVNGELVNVLNDYTASGVAEHGTTVDFLKKRGVKKVFTAYIPPDGEYLGVEGKYTDQDGDVTTYQCVDHFGNSLLKDTGIEVIFIPD